MSGSTICRRCTPDVRLTTRKQSEYDSLDLRLCQEELAKTLYLLFEKNPFVWEHENGDKQSFYYEKAKAISDNVAKIVKVGK